MRPSPVSRLPVMASLGVHVEGACLPHVDMSDSATTRAGAQGRFCRTTPPINRNKLERFRLFVRRWLCANLTPLSVSTDTSFETWIQRTNYPEWRRKELRLVYQDLLENGWDGSYEKLSSFVKDEQYGEFKHARCINARSDEYKVTVGPHIKCIEDQIYALPQFIKHIPVALRPAYIRDYLEREGVNYVATDYTSFEALFTAEIQEACEMQLYHYMLHLTEGGRNVYDLMERVQMGKNVCEFKYLTVKVRAKRMSGEMCTSLGNGFTNLMVMLFTAEEVGARNVRGCVEGDDGLFSMEGNIPRIRDFEELGMIIKLEVHPNVNTASFCGMIFDTKDEIVISDVMSHLTRFGWTKAKYLGARDVVLKRLLRSKALSMLYSYPGCPVLWKLARYGLRVTQSEARIDLSRYYDSWWDREQAEMRKKVDFWEVWSRTPSANSRLLVEEKYGLTVPDQLKIEEYLDSLETITPLDHPTIHSYMHPDWLLYSAKYTVPVDVRSDLREDAWVKMTRFRFQWA